MAEEPLLEIRALTKSFGGLRVSDSIDLAIPRGETRAVIGPNGAGKTTLVNQIAGQIRPDQGSILFQGLRIDALPAHRIARLGIGRSFQRTNLFPDLSVLGNVLLAAQSRRLARSGRPLWLRGWRPAAAYAAPRALAEAVLGQTGLAAHAERRAGELSHGGQRQLEIAMVLALEPELLLLDEPMAGLSMEESRDMIALLASLKGRHTIMLIEHDMDAVFALADRISVLVYGRVIATGDGAAIRADAAVREAYLGEA